jgi:cyanophycinase-like exopeptidase
MSARTPRILAVMGSGETAPTMSRVHRSILERVGPAPVPAVLLDTPYGFQENADDISGRTMDYFRETVGNPIGVASLRTADADVLTRATAAARIREARYVFAGPGSPSYALRQWSGTDIPRLMAEKLATGGAVVLASAAALTTGILTIPVYEIYKVGDDPSWLPGLDLLFPATGLRAAVVPHYDNNEGGTHDTRFCYMGERRLVALERDLPDDAFVLGVDSHTALILDLDERTATVAGVGGVTVRVRGRSVVFPSGSAMPIADLEVAARRLRSGSSGTAAGDRDAEGRTGAGAAAGGPAFAPGDGAAAGPEDGGLAGAVAREERAFDEAVARRDVPAAIAAILALEETIVAWSRDTGDASDHGHARSVLRSLVIRLGDLAVEGARDPREAVAPFVDTLLEARLRARAAKDWATSDAIRDRLVAAGIEVRDTAEGTEWDLAGGTGGEAGGA